MRKTAPDRATVADLVMRDMRDGRVQQRMRRHQRLIVLDVAPAYERAEPTAVIAEGNITEPGQPPQIDQQARGRQAEGENRHQTLSPGDDERLGVRHEQVDCFAKGGGSLVIEGRGFHCYALRDKTEPGALCTRRRSRERCVRDPIGRTSIANSQPRWALGMRKARCCARPSGGAQTLTSP
jgi:hypothetical protein